MVGTMDVYVLLCMIPTSTPAVLNKPRELATVTMWPWFSSSILGRNALVVWGKDRRDRRAKGKKGGRLVHLCSLSVPKPFDPLCLPLTPPIPYLFLRLLHGDAERGVWMRIHNGHKKKKKKKGRVNTGGAAFECTKINKSYIECFFFCGRCELDAEERRWRFSPSSGILWTSRYVVCVLPYNLFFSHTDLVPVVGPGSKELVTTPIIGLRSLNTSNNTIQPLVYPRNLVPSQQNNR